MLQQLGMALVSATCLQAEVWDRCCLHFLDLSAGEFAHELRFHARHLMWQQTGRRRDDMAGLEGGVDVEASTALLRKVGKEAVHKGFLRSILSGAVVAGHRLNKMRPSNGEWCLYCDSMTAETTYHLFWECTCWQSIRETHALALQAWKPDWPACFSCCGILTAGVRIDVPARDPEAAKSVGKPENGPLLLVLDETFLGGCVVVYTDGACLHNQHTCLRKAGVGAWWADGHSHNISEPLPGIAQTNQRAELLAVIRVLQVEPRPLHIKTDSQYVLNGCLRHRFAWAAASWRKIKNSDLWKQLHNLLEDRSAGFNITKVKGHATADDVASGRVALSDKHGNDAADALAGKGAATHALPSAEVRAVKHRHAVAQSVQRMMVDILLARAACKLEDGSSASSSSSPRSDGCISSTSSTESSHSEPDDHVGIDVQTQVSLHSGSNHPT